MRDNGHPASLNDVLDRLDEAARHSDPVTLAAIIAAVGQESFGPLLLILGLIAVSPISGIPGMPTTIGLLVLLVAGQLLLLRKRFWLPAWLLRRTVSQAGLIKAVRLMRTPARKIDSWLRPRLTVLTGDTGQYLIAASSAAIAATMPPLELVPFAATTAGVGITALGLALIARDGVFELAALALALAALGFVAYSVI